MLNDSTLEKLTEILIKRIEESNQYFLKKIARDIKRLKNLTPTDAIELAQMLKFGGDYNKIINEISRLTNMNVNDIKKIFRAVAKKNQDFAKQFYDYRNVRFIPYDENNALKTQVQALANVTAGDYLNMANTRAIGYLLKDVDGNVIFRNISDVYRDTIDKAVLNIMQGRSTFDSEMRKRMKEIAKSGLRYVEYESGKTRRLDSAVRMNLMGALRDMTNDIQKQFGETFNSDGVEISVHSIPAPDHADVQGHQFRNAEFKKFQNDDDCVDVDGVEFKSEFNGHDRRSIGEYNCYHYIFSIIVGISKPLYTKEDLDKIKNNANEEFIFEGKKYTRYQGTQLQRKIESKIREQKDIQILGRESGYRDMSEEAQSKINLLNDKYKKVCNTFNLKKKEDRLRVSGYNKIKVHE